MNLAMLHPEDPRCRILGAALHCGDAGGFFTSASTSKQLAQTTGDQGLIVTGKAAVVSQPGSIAVGARGKYQEAGAFDFTGAKGTTITTNLQNVDPEIIADALQTVRESDQNLVDAIRSAQAATGEQTASGNEAVATALGKLGDLLQSQQTGGQTALLKPLVILGLAVAAVIAFIFWTKK